MAQEPFSRDVAMPPQSNRESKCFAELKPRSPCGPLWRNSVQNLTTESQRLIDHDLSPELHFPGSQSVRTSRMQPENSFHSRTTKPLRLLLFGFFVYLTCANATIGLSFAKSTTNTLNNVSWWVIFIPTWFGNLAVIGILAFSILIYTRLWTEATGREGLAILANDQDDICIPLLRKTAGVYFIALPSFALILVCEILLCHFLDKRGGVSLGMSLIPLFLLEVAGCVYYLLCQTRNHFPGVFWLLSLVFTVLVSYKIDAGVPEQPQWWIVFSPVFALTCIGLALLLRLSINICRRHYAPNKGHISAGLLNFVALTAFTIGTAMICPDIKVPRSYLRLACTALFVGTVTESVVIFLVASLRLSTLEASRGATKPISLALTRVGWVPATDSHDRYLFVGDIPLTSEGTQLRVEQARIRAMSEAAAEAEQFERVHDVRKPRSATEVVDSLF